ncbi:hypothetical protein QBC43DRAFT_315714 [Cladorrhinum sp. PSN259]|nr:hypothetical protein QBC43DRAFT_315714 [Cladorrhinum sp. PSN259]
MSTPTESEKAAIAPEVERRDEAQEAVKKEASETVEKDATKETEAESQSPDGDEQEDAPSPTPSNDSSEDEEGEVSDTEDASAAPPLPNELLPDTNGAPPLPSEPLPSATEQQQQREQPEDDGWDCHWNPNDSSWWFYNRFTGVWQKENPRMQTTATQTPAAPAAPLPPNTDKTSISDPTSLAGGYNPAIHGSYDENAWYAKNARALAEQSAPQVLDPAVAAAMLAQSQGQGGGAGGAEYATGGYFNRFTGQWQMPEQGVEKHSDEAKSRRQMAAFFDVDAAANNMHDGRSLKAERSGKKPTKKELKEFKEKRRQKKEERRRAWLKD